MSIKPFKISIPDSSFNVLRQKLALSVFPDSLEGSGRDYGTSLDDVTRLVTRWKDGFDWRLQESRLNDEMEQFTTNIDVEGHGILNIHFVHAKSKVENAIPLMFVHGWPKSFLEVRKILPLLVADGGDEHPSFHVVALSLPGYGFSEGPKKPGFGFTQYAEVCHKLMLALGYDKYVTQGSDWGTMITMTMGNLYGHKHHMAWHTNMSIASPAPFTTSPFHWLSNLVTPYSESDLQGIQRSAWFPTYGNGFLVLQTTQPQSLGYSLADSPAGLLAWIYEKMVNWTDDYTWDDDEVLTWVSIYWFSRAGVTSTLRMNKDCIVSPDFMDRWPTIPHGYSRFPKELVLPPKRWIEARANLVYYSEHSKGGHFAAHEQPTELVKDVRKMFGKDGPAFNVVDKLNGYRQ